MPKLNTPSLLRLRATRPTRHAFGAGDWSSVACRPCGIERHGPSAEYPDPGREPGAGLPTRISVIGSGLHHPETGAITGRVLRSPSGSLFCLVLLRAPERLLRRQASTHADRRRRDRTLSPGSAGAPAMLIGSTCARRAVGLARLERSSVHIHVTTDVWKGRFPVDVLSPSRVDCGIRARQETVRTVECAGRIEATRENRVSGLPMSQVATRQARHTN